MGSQNPRNRHVALPTEPAPLQSALAASSLSTYTRDAIISPGRAGGRLTTQARGRDSAGARACTHPSSSARPSHLRSRARARIDAAIAELSPAAAAPVRDERRRNATRMEE